MCFFAQVNYGCGDWKWGNMKERCPRQHRIGETCGAKLVHPDHVDNRPSEFCKTCLEIEVKKRRLQKLQENISRWETQGNSFENLLDKAKAERLQVIAKIKELNAKRTSVVFRGSNSEDSPSKAVTSDSGSSFTYSTSSKGYPSISSPTSSGYASGGHDSGPPQTASRPGGARHGSHYYSPYST